MDHLQWTLGSDLPGAIFEVPYISGNYDRGEFTTFGERRGYPWIGDLLQLHLEDPIAFQKLLQQWLYFGLLWEMFGSRYKRKDFITPGPSRRLTSAKLPEYCQRWIQEGHDIKKKRRSIDFAASLSNQLDDAIRDQEVLDPRIILFSVKILIETLSSALGHGGIRPTVSTYLVDYMVNSGWCPSRLAASSLYTQSQSLYLFTALDPSTMIGGNHQSCKRGLCAMDSLPKYPPQHTPKCRSTICPLIHVPAEKLTAICTNGDVPVLSCTVDSMGGLLVDVVSSRKCRGFVAISHVWADGLGNDEENALYDCQLRDVMRQVSNTRDVMMGPSPESLNLTDEPLPHNTHTPGAPVYFWLDTMCIPFTGPARKSAIGRIDWTIAAADAVLVRDNALRNISITATPPLLLAMHLHCLKWLTRCWTLAEGVAAWQLYIHFADRVVSLRALCVWLRSQERPWQYARSISPRISESLLSDEEGFEMQSQTGVDLEIRGRVTESPAGPEPEPDSEIDIHQEFLSAQRRNLLSDLTKIVDAHYVFRFKLDYSRDTRRFGNLIDFKAAWNNLLNRSTTKLEDVPGVFAMLNGVSTRDVFGASPHERLKGILNTLTEIPASLFFSHGSKFDEEPKNRWVPTQIHGASVLSGGANITTYREGLMVGPFVGFQLFTFRGIQMEHFCLSSDIPERTRHIHVEILSSDVIARYSPDQEWCLVLPESFEDSGFLAQVSCTAFCAAIQSRDGDNILGTWETLAEVRVISTQSPCSANDLLLGQASDSTCHLFIECDMTQWPSPTALSRFFVPEQKQNLIYLKYKMYLIGLAIWFVSSCIAIAFGLLSKSSKVRLGVGVGVSAQLILGCVIMIAFSRWRDHHRLTKEDPHEEWKSVFLDPYSRARREPLYFIFIWLRRLYGINNSGTSKTPLPTEELESQGSAQMSTSTFRTRFLWTRANVKTDAILILARLTLCVAQLGILSRIIYVIKGALLQYLVAFLLCVPPGISLIISPIGMSLWFNQLTHRVERPIWYNLLGLFFWLLHMAILAGITRKSSVMRPCYKLGVAGAVFAGIQA